MVSGSAGPLTRIGFRRDVRVFLTLLVGLLGFLIVVLLLEMQGLAEDLQASLLTRWNAVADASALELAASGSESNRRILAMVLLQRYGLLAIELRGAETERFGIPPSEDDHVITRTVGASGVAVVFDASELRIIQRRFAVTASICIAAAFTGMVLLLLYLPRITKPIEELLGEASQLETRDERQEETAYLIRTFRESITRLKVQEGELKRLHESEKSRADELALVSATLTRSLTSGFIALDPEGRVMEVNAAARETLGIPAERDVREPISLLAGDTPLARAVTRAIENRETITRIEVEHSAGPALMTIGLTAVPLVGEGGKLLGLIALFTDLTPIKRLEARVRAMQTLADLGEMAAGIVHELRNSMSTITGYIRLVLRSDLPEEAMLRLRAAEEEAAQLNRAVDHLLAFARPMELEVEPVDLREVVSGIVSRLAEAAPLVRFEIHGEASIDGDCTLLGRAVENIVRNAIDAVAQRDDGARIDIEIEDDPPAVRISDNGVGLDPSRAGRLLLPFVSEKPGGFGLGLSLARKIVILHGGDLELSGSPGEGATATMHFPARKG